MSTISWGVDRVVMWVLAALMATETVVVFSAVVSRYFLNYSFAWSDEVARALLCWIIFLGGSAAYRRQELVDIPFFKEMLNKTALRVLMIFSAFFIAIFLGYIIYYGYLLAVKTSRQITPVLGLHLYYISGAVVVGSAITLLHVLADLIDYVSGKEIARKVFSDDVRQVVAENALPESGLN